MPNLLVTEKDLRTVPPPDSVIKLVQQLVAGNREAEADFYKVFQPLVSRWIHRLGGKRHSPERMSIPSRYDAVESAMARLIYGQILEGRNSPLRKWLDFKGPNRMSLYRYVRTNVEYFFKDFAIGYAALRTREFRGEAEPVICGGADCSVERRVQLNRCIQQCMENMSSEARTIIIKVFYEGHTQAEVAHMLNMNEVTFSRRCRKAVEQFSNLVRENCPEGIWRSALLK